MIVFNLRYARVVILLSLLLLPMSAFSQSYSVIVEADILNVRNSPWGKKIGNVCYGQQFIVEKCEDNWGLITYKAGQKGWVSLEYTHRYTALPQSVSKDELCKKLNSEFDRLGWEDIQCRPEDWETGGASVQGKPLLYSEYNGSKSSITLLICSVHSDESTCYHCFRLNDLLRNNPHLLLNRLIIVPLLNPDGFLTDNKTRTNANGVDLNRNLPSTDWHKLAINAWVKRYDKDPRRNPGPTANSEPENRFLLDLINRYHPDKVISIHSPLNFLEAFR